MQAEKKARQEAAKVALAEEKSKKAAFTKVIGKVQGPIAALSAVINDPVGIYVPSQGMEEAKATFGAAQAHIHCVLHRNHECGGWGYSAFVGRGC